MSFLIDHSVMGSAYAYLCILHQVCVYIIVGSTNNNKVEFGLNFAHATDEDGLFYLCCLGEWVWH